jgi:CRISPR-associated exonuclease Cas4
MIMAWNGLTISLALIFVAMAGLLLLRARSLQESSGLPGGDVIYTDTGTWFRNDEPLHSTADRLIGKPDYLVELRNGEIIPVEIKTGSAPASPWPGHVLQLAAYCRLVEDVYGIRPSYGILQYRDRAFTVPYSAELEGDLLSVMAGMREDRGAEDILRSHNSQARCAACSFSETCSESLVLAQPTLV